MRSIAFFTDTAMLPGLHVALLSLLDFLPPDAEAEIWIFTDGVSDKEKEYLRLTHAIQPRHTRLILKDFIPKGPEGANSLHGNLANYGRVYLPDLLPDTQQCIYLDCDLLVRRSVFDLFTFFDQKHTLYVDGDAVRRGVLDKELFKLAGLDMEGPCFNSGVMAMDLNLWRTRDRSAACAAAARKYSGMFLSADQALLNVVFHDDFVAVGTDFNAALYPTSPQLSEPQNKIYHFVGSPKPWDTLGNRLHQNYKLWKDVFNRTAIGNQSLRRYHSLSRTLRISRSILKAWKERPRQAN